MKLPKIDKKTLLIGGAGVALVAAFFLIRPKGSSDEGGDETGSGYIIGGGLGYPPLSIGTLSNEAVTGAGGVTQQQLLDATLESIRSGAAESQSAIAAQFWTTLPDALKATGTLGAAGNFKWGDQAISFDYQMFKPVTTPPKPNNQQPSVSQQIADFSNIASIGGGKGNKK